MLRILTSLVAVLMFSGTLWAIDNQSASLNIEELRADDKPIPLFPKMEASAEKLAPSVPETQNNQKPAPVIQEKRVQKPSQTTKETSDPAVAENAKDRGQVRETNQAVKLDSSLPNENAAEQPKAVSKALHKEVAATKKISEEATVSLNNEKLNKLQPGNQQAGLKTEPEANKLQDTQQNVAASTQDLQVVDFVLTNQIVNREPQGTLENFAEGSERGSVFARLHAKANTEVTFVWYRNNQEYTRYKAPVQATKQWRTFSTVKLRSGDWKVQLLGKNNEVLAEKAFSIK